MCCGLVCSVLNIMLSPVLFDILKLKGFNNYECLCDIFLLILSLTIEISLISERTGQEAVLNCSACSQNLISYRVSSPDDKEFCSTDNPDSHCQVEETPLVDNCKTLSLTLNLTDTQWWDYSHYVLVVFTVPFARNSNGTPVNPPENVFCTATVDIVTASTGEPCTGVPFWQ